jgi:hypothetical protein
MAWYRLSASIAGVEQSAKGLHIIQISAGEVLNLPELDKESGLVELVFHGHNVSVFAQDLRVRSSRIDEGDGARPGLTAPGDSNVT